jgi:nitroreductase
MIAFTHLMLAAESLGWDTAPMEGFDSAAVRKELGLQEDSVIVALLAIGRLKGTDRAFPGRLPLSRVFFDETIERGWEGN